MPGNLKCVRCGKRLSTIASVSRGVYPVYGMWDDNARCETCAQLHSREMMLIRTIMVLTKLASGSVEPITI